MPTNLEMSPSVSAKRLHYGIASADGRFDVPPEHATQGGARDAYMKQIGMAQDASEYSATRAGLNVKWVDAGESFQALEDKFFSVHSHKGGRAVNTPIQEMNWQQQTKMSR